MFTRNVATKKLAPTPAVEEGPYYKEGSPGRRNIADPDTPGKLFILEGRVRDTSGKPIAAAWLDFWQADGNGQYDNENFRLRGHQYTEKDGKYRLETIKPMGYQERAPHIHCKVRARDNSPVITTQLFFAGDVKNATDLIFEELTAVECKRFKDGEKASFDIIIEV
jgi:protocatechuate 3,4-dioxygenase beta subunit